MSSRIFRNDLLEGQVALVTGGGTGIGAAISAELARLGMTVVIGSRKAEHIEPAAAGLSKLVGRTVHPAIVDIRDREGLSTVVADIIETHGRLDLLVNNGGGQFFSPAEAIRPKGWNAVIDTNLTGTWNATRAVADGWMLKHGGKIVHITMLTHRAFPGMAHSVAARSGVEAMTRTLAVEWASRGVLLNSIQPGFIASSGLKRYPKGLGLIEKLKGVVPLKRLGTTEEIAWLVAYLASPAGDYITGQTLTVDGGKDQWGDYWPIPDPPGMSEVVIPPEPWEESE
jgi:NAD(P)-dependent dehydrogenase (short-subunit alcohol dehydrogenase family)